MKNVVVGIDIGGTNSVFGLVDDSGNILSRKAIKTGAYEKFEEYVEAAAQVIESFEQDFPDSKIVTIGIGAPDANYYQGTIDHASNLRWSGILPLRSSFETRLSLPVVTTNDANAAALGEKLFGGAKDSDHFVVITLGTGLGSGFVIDGKLVYGKNSYAGEVGNIVLIPEGRVCGCGRRGCAETYVSATGLVRTTIELLSELTVDSPLRDMVTRDITSKQVYDLAIAGDEIACEAFARTAEYLGQILADTILFSNPDTIFLFGGLANAGDLLMKPLKEAFERRTLTMFRGTAEIKLSQLPEADAALLGSAALAWEEFQKKMN